MSRLKKILLGTAIAFGVLFSLALVLPIVMPHREFYPRQMDEIAVGQLKNALLLYHKECGRFPDADHWKAQLLSEKPCGEYSEAYMKSIPRDAWKRDYELTLFPDRVQIKAFGRDGKEGGEGRDEDYQVIVVPGEGDSAGEAVAQSSCVTAASSPLDSLILKIRKELPASDLKTLNAIDEAREDLKLVLCGKQPKNSAFKSAKLDGGTESFVHSGYKLTVHRRAGTKDGRAGFFYGPELQFTDPKIRERQVFSQVNFYTRDEIQKLLGERFK